MIALTLVYSATSYVATTPVRDPSKDRCVVIVSGGDLGTCIENATAHVIHYVTPTSLGGAGYESIRTVIESRCDTCNGSGKLNHGFQKPSTKCKPCKGTGAPAVICSYLTEREELPPGLLAAARQLDAKAAP